MLWLDKVKFKNDLTQRRWDIFVADRFAVVSLLLILLFAFFSFTAEFWSNSKPLVASYDGQLIVPVLMDYHPSTFGVETEFVTNYRNLDFEKEGNWAIWPLNEWNPYESNFSVDRYPSPPSWDNLLGTDDRGRDLLARVLYGFRYSMTYAILVWFFSTVLGVIAGATMGFAGGKVDIIGQRVVEIFSSLPYLLILITLISIFSPNIWVLTILTTAFSWVTMSYYMRAEFLKNRKLDYIEAARALGVKTPVILFKHILPNSLTPLITFSPFLITAHINGLAILEFLGFGLPPPTPSWGELLQQAKNEFTTAWWLALAPSAALFFTLVWLNFIGFGIRAAFDPRKVVVNKS